VSGRAELGLRLDTLALSNGKVWRFSAAVDSVDAQGTGQKAQKEEGVVRQGSDRGRDVELRRGSTIDIVLDRPLTID